MKSIDQPVTASFRFLSLDMMQAYTLKKEVSGAWFYKDEAKEVFVGVVPYGFAFRERQYGGSPNVVEGQIAYSLPVAFRALDRLFFLSVL